MAEFYEVLKRAVGALPESSGDARRAVYERARKALIAQLEGFSPPLTPSEITSQRLSLEEAIRKVEGEAARAALGLGLGLPPTPEPEAPSDPVPDTPVADAPVEPEPAVVDSHPDVAPRPAAPPEEPELTVSAPAPAPVSDLTVSDPPPGVPPATNREQGPPAGPIAQPDPTLRSPPPLNAGAEQSDFPQEIQQSRLPLIAGAAAAFLIVVGLSAVIYSQRDALFGEADPVAEAVVDPAATEEEAEPEPTQQAARPSLTESPRPEKSEDRIPGGAPVRDVTDNAVRAVQTQRINVPPNAQTGGLGTLTGTPGTEPATPVPNPASATDDAAAEPQVAATEPTAPTEDASNEPGAVAQTAFLYEEGTPNSGSSAAVRGQVVWAKTTEEGVSAVVATVTVPEKDATIKITIKPNNEDGFPASHLVEMEFSGVLASTVRNVPGLIMKTSEQEQGEALVGAAIKVTDGLFWIALSAEDRDLSRNRSLLESRGWLDIPLLYGSGKRAILTLEKGVPGDQAIEAAFGDWGRG